MKRFFSVFITFFFISLAAGCANIGSASKSSASLASLLGFAELPDWFINSKYSYGDSQWIENDFGLPIHYRDVGEGPILILLHGEISSLHTWEPWIEELTKEYRVIAIDLPGSGLTGAPACMDDPKDTCSENLTLDYVQHTLEYFIADMNISKFTLVGSSFGGYLATQYALQHPEMIEKLVLISPLGFQQEAPSIVSYMSSAGGNLLSYFIQPANIIATIVDDFYGERDRLMRDNLNRYIDLAQSEGAHRSNVMQLRMVSEIMERGMTTSLDGIDAPTLIMWGEYDTWGNVTHADRWKEEIQNSMLVKYPFFGHIPMEESPKNTIVDIVAFLKDEPLPTLEGLGTGGTFTIEEAAGNLDQEALFGNPPPAPTKSLGSDAPTSLGIEEEQK